MSVTTDHVGHSDDDLLRRWLAGQADAFSAIVEKYQQVLERVAANAMRRDRQLMADVGDVVQSVFIELLSAGGELLAKGKPLRPWLIRVTANKAIDVGRRKKSKPVSGSGGLFDALAGPSERPLTDAEAALELCLEQLPERARLALQLKHWEGMPQTDIADALGVVDSTASVLIGKAHQQLQACIELRLTNPSGGWS